MDGTFTCNTHRKKEKKKRSRFEREKERPFQEREREVVSRERERSFRERERERGRFERERERSFREREVVSRERERERERERDVARGNFRCRHVASTLTMKARGAILLTTEIGCNHRQFLLITPKHHCVRIRPDNLGRLFTIDIASMCGRPHPSPLDGITKQSIAS